MDAQRQKPKTTNGFRHREAYCLMKYASDDGSVVEWIWNSRDGVTPFIVKSRCGKEMTHVQWEYDVRILNYKPLASERVFVDATPERVRPSAEAAVRRDHPAAGGQLFEDLVTQQTRAWLTMLGAPWVILGSEYQPIPAAEASPLSLAIEKARQANKEG